MTRTVPDKTHTIGHPKWMRYALCRDHPSHWWFPSLPLTLEVLHGIATAKAICGTCQVQQDCLNYSLRWGAEGIWGGLGTDERRDLRRRTGVRLHQHTTP
jgi:WhiB family redox-sensing transcriptional regulator